MAFDPKAFVAGQPQPTSSNGFDPVAFVTGKPQAEIKQDYPIRRAISNYVVHPVIEAGGTGIVGGAAALLASPAGPIPAALAGSAGAIAAYPAAHEAANAVDEMMGISPRKVPTTDIERLKQELNQGAIMEATGQTLPVVTSAISKIPFSKFGSAFTGTPASNLTRAYDKGLSTYVAKPLNEAGKNYGAQESRVMMDYLTPKEQADMVTNPSSFAGGKLNDVMTRWLSGGDISVKDALQAKQAINVLYPSDTAKKAVLRGKMSDFGDAMNQVIASKDPAMRGAIQDYADSSLRSQLLQPLRVNKTNPNEPSKLGIMLGTEGVATSDNPFETAIKVFTLQSPAFMGFVSALSGQIAKIVPNLSENSQRTLAKGLYASFLNSKNGTQK